MKLLTKVHRCLLPADEDVGYSAYINLFFLVLFFGNLYFRPAHGVDWAIVIVGLITFLFCYFRALSAQEHELPYYIAGILLIGVALSEINVGASVFFVYAAAFCGDFSSQKKSFTVLLLVLLFTGLYALLTDKSSYFWIPAITMSAAFGILNIHRSEVLQKNKALKQSQLETKQLAEIAERERISRDLHDLLGHSLSVITLKSELAGKMMIKGYAQDKIIAEINAIETLSRETLAQVRGAVKGYNSATIAGELLQAKVATQAANIELIATIAAPSLPAKIESELALIIREAITNVIRHAETQKVWIDLTQVAKQLTLTISDQGQMTSHQAHAGMLNMRSRITDLGGEMHIQHQPNTQLQFILKATESWQTLDASSALSTN